MRIYQFYIFLLLLRNYPFTCASLLCATTHLHAHLYFAQLPIYSAQLPILFINIYLPIILIILIGTIYSILLDELIIGNTQRRKGPFNLGGYGILSSIINGFNLIITQFIIPKLYIHYWFQAFPIAFLLFSLAIFNIIFPFFVIDLYLSFIVLLLLSGISIILLFLLSYTGLSKYAMLGCIRLISQFVAYELILTTLLLLLIYSFNELNITNYYLFLYIFNILYFTTTFARFSIVLILVYLLFYNYVFVLISLICILAELNRVPFDLPESESELVAGFITEYSSIYFSLILLTEYTNIIALILFVIILFSIIFSASMILLSLICVIRSTFNRLKFDELMTNCWIVILPIIFTFCLIMLLSNFNIVMRKWVNNYPFYWIIAQLPILMRNYPFTDYSYNLLRNYPFTVRNYPFYIAFLYCQF